MEKRLFLAVAVSIAFLWLWAAMLPRIFPQLVVKPKPASTDQQTPTKPAAEATATTSSAALQPGASVTAAPSVAAQTAPPATQPSERVAATSEEASTVETPEYVARFSNRGAQLVSFRLKDYKTRSGQLVELIKSRPAGRSDFPFAIEASDGRVNRVANEGFYVLTREKTGAGERLTFRVDDGSGVAVVKEFRLGPNYDFHFAVSVLPATTAYRVMVGPGLRVLGPEERDNQFVITGNPVIQQDGSLDVIAREKAPKLKFYEGSADFIGIEDNYFLAAIRPDKAGSPVLRSIEIPAATKDDLKRKEVYVGFNAVNGGASGKAFFGPKQATVLEAHGLEKTLQFGAFGMIARFLLTALIAIHTFTKNYGWAIVVLTVLIKLVLYPLQHKSIVSMKKMQKVQPKMTAIRDRYKKAKTDPEQRQKMNVEMMNLYKVEGISPVGGCLPLLLQLPILWGFYGLLSRAIELRGAPFFGWIQDLSDKDPYYITPILMTITMFIQQAITPSTADPTQKRIFMAMPFIFGWIFKEFPSGLVLYWLVQNILTIAQQMIMNKYWADHPES
ncbi:MAG TPA: membrane protein insertase YidC [Thermoanaerobaculia bacterium]|nr:membrane protein insertase YidC [Thermoanaerobaculia bacterium]